MDLETERLVLKEAEPADLENLHQVFISNTEFLELRPDVAATGGYDVASVRRYWEGARLDPRRHILTIRDGATNETIGLIDFVTESPADGYPWIGLVLVAESRQRHAIGTETVAAVVAHLRAEDHLAVRMAVIESNEAGLAFARSLGFETVTEVPTTGTEALVRVMELNLAAPHRPA